jgi:hypothetical protein
MTFIQAREKFSARRAEHGAKTGVLCQLRECNEQQHEVAVILAFELGEMLLYSGVCCATR